MRGLLIAVIVATTTIAYAEQFSIKAVAPDGTSVDAKIIVTDSAGASHKPPFEGVKPGPGKVTVSSVGFRTRTVELDLADGGEYTVRLQYDESFLSDTVIEIEGEIPELEEDPIVMTRDTINTIPGARNDPLVAIQNLPGVSRTPVGLGGLILRGSSPRDTSVYLDGIKVPILYHFGGLTSFMPSQMLDDVKLYAGGFDVRYGRSQGGLVEVTSRSDLDNGKDYALYGDVNLIDAQAFGATKVGGGLFKASIRRSYVDAILAAAPLGDQIDLTIAPQYYDGQVMWSRKFGRTDLKLLSFFSIDRTALAVESDDGSTGSFSLEQGFWRVGAPVTVNISDDWKLKGTLFIGQDTADFRVSNSKLDFAVLRYGGRMSLAQVTNKTLRGSIGIDFDGGYFSTDIINNLPRGLDPAQRGEVRVQSNSNNNDIGIFAKASWEPLEGLTIRPGLRLDYFSLSDELVFNPRLEVSQMFGKLEWVNTAGIYHQPPVPADTTMEFGNPDLQSSNSVQISSGFKRKWKRGQARVTGFYEILEDQPVDVVSGATPLASSRYGGGIGSFTLESTRELYGTWSYQDNLGIGRNYGVEMILQHKAEKWFGWLSYTYTRSMRRDDPNWLPDYHVGILDQPHTFTGVFAYELPRQWTLSTRLRLVSGYPFTAVDGAYFDTDQNQYQPISNTLLGERLPMFFQWDIRAQKTWTWQKAEMSLYLDVQNVTNHVNAEGVRYDYDYQNRAYTRGLPIFPSLGLEVKLL